MARGARARRHLVHSDLASVKKAPITSQFGERRSPGTKSWLQSRRYQIALRALRLLSFPMPHIFHRAICAGLAGGAGDEITTGAGTRILL
mmetsp:Transcript_126539/g.300537  ORF Transcript_126539/g.300537 Transcript_126539/m.300537 type:complete len:90 (-) Transcript_126539:300-569(-)